MKDRIWRLPPCPPYDVEGMESWLSDMAAQGWRLEPDDFFLGIASFRKSEPAAVRYHLEASPKRVSAWDDDGGVPDREAWELNADQGWEYAGRRGQFFIYRCASASAPELHTDPQVQAMALKAVEKRQLRSLILLTAYWLFYAFLWLWRGGSLLLFAAYAGLPMVLLLAAMLLGALAMGIGEVVYLGGLKRRLQEGLPPDRRKDWKKTRRRHLGGRALFWAVFLLFLVLTLRLMGDLLMHRDRQPRSEYPGEPPFATLADFAEGEYRLTWNDLMGQLDYASWWANAFLRAGTVWHEHAEVRRPDGSTLDGILYVDYFAARSEWLAKGIAAELRRVDRARAGKNYEDLELPELGMDDAAAYRDEIHRPRVVLRRGSTVLRAAFCQIGEGERLSLEEWAGIMAASLR